MEEFITENGKKIEFRNSIEDINTMETTSRIATTIMSFFSLLSFFWALWSIGNNAELLFLGIVGMIFFGFASIEFTIIMYYWKIRMIDLIYKQKEVKSNGV